MSERRLCSFFRARSRARTPCTPHVESMSALPYGASMNASTRCEGGTFIAHNRADERRGRDRIIYLSSRQFFSWLRFMVCGLSAFLPPWWLYLSDLPGSRGPRPECSAFPPTVYFPTGYDKILVAALAGAGLLAQPALEWSPHGSWHTSGQGSSRDPRLSGARTTHGARRLVAPRARCARGEWHQHNPRRTSGQCSSRSTRLSGACTTPTRVGG